MLVIHGHDHDIDYYHERGGGSRDHVHTERVSAERHWSVSSAPWAYGTRPAARNRPLLTVLSTQCDVVIW